MSHSLLLWFLRALGAICCLFFAVPSFGLAVHKLTKPSVLEDFAGVGGLGEGIHIAKRFLLPVLGCWMAVLFQVFPPIPMKPIYSFHKRSRHFLLPSEEKPCPAYITPLKSKWGEM